MIKELSFFKMMFFVFLAFFLSALIIFSFAFSGTDNYPGINIFLGGVIGVSFIAVIKDLYFKELYFFKIIFFVFLAFFLSALIIFLFAFSGTDNYGIHIFLGGIIGISFIAMIFFSPVLLVVAFCQYWIKNYKLKNSISFLLMTSYGYIFFFQQDLKVISCLIWFTCPKRILHFLLLSIVSTFFFLVVLSYLVSLYKKRKNSNE